MNELRFFLNNKETNPPENYQETEIELNFDRDKDNVKAQISDVDYVFVNENADTILAWVNGGLTGTSPGINEGIPWRTELTVAGKTQVPFNGYLDTVDGPSFSKIKCVCKAKNRLVVDWMNDVAASFSPRFLYEGIGGGNTGLAAPYAPGAITSADWVFMPYVLNSIPDAVHACLTTVAVYGETRRLIDAITTISKDAADVAGLFTTASGIAKAILDIANLALAIIEMIILIKQLFNLLVQPVKYHCGMYAKTLLQRGCEYVGLTFQSDIFDDPVWSRLVIIPEKHRVPPASDGILQGFFEPNPTEQVGYYKGTFKDLLVKIKSLTRSKIIISDSGVLSLVRQDKYTSAPQFQIPDIQNFVFTTNASEMNGSCNLSFRTDINDKNTIQQYLGTEYEVVTTPTAINDQNNVLIRNFKDVDLGFALAKTKRSLSLPETLLQDFFVVANPIVNALTITINSMIVVANAIVDTINDIVDALSFVGIDVGWKLYPIKPLQPARFDNLIENRLGMLMIETDYISEAKLFLIKPGTEPLFNKIDPLNDLILSARNIYNNFHVIDSFVPTPGLPFGAQRIIKEFAEVPFTYENFLQVINNPLVFYLDSVGGGNLTAECETIKWNVFLQKAFMRIRILSLFTKNLQQTFLEPNGQ